MLYEVKRVALITGCSEPSSLGAAMARVLIQRGWRVFASALTLSSMYGLKDLGCDILEIDVTSDESISEAVSQLSDLTGSRLDLLINNAGVAALCPLLDLDIKRLQALYDVNVFGPVRMLQACSELLIATSAKQEQPGNSTVLNITSTTRFMPPWQGAYGSSKMALANISETMRMELEPLGVRVLLASLGGVKTPLLLGQMIFPLRRLEISTNPTRSHYPNFDQVKKTALERFYPRTSSESVAIILIDAVENKSNKAETTIWAGDKTFLYKYILSRLPIAWVWGLWKRLAGVNEINFVKNLTKAKKE